MRKPAASAHRLLFPLLAMVVPIISNCRVRLSCIITRGIATSNDAVFGVSLIGIADQTYPKKCYCEGVENERKGFGVGASCINARFEESI